mmetsp:Transcript_16058/g.27665  ORF Transcript_16058/g.27665 Transcript_16058/m.27665 type:complete len:1053 (-) Transcript_16058:281-3439(-)
MLKLPEFEPQSVLYYVYWSVGFGAFCASLPILISIGFLIATLVSIVLLVSILVIPLIWAVNPEAVKKFFELGPILANAVINWMMEHDDYEKSLLEIKKTVNDWKTCKLPKKVRQIRRRVPSSMRIRRGGNRALRNGRSSIRSMLMGREVHGSTGYVTVTQLPKEVVGNVDSTENRIPSLVLRLHNSLEALMSWHCLYGLQCIGHHENRTARMNHINNNFYDKNKREAWMRESLSMLEEVQRRVCEIPIDGDSPTPRLPCTFVQYGGANLLVKFLRCTIPASFGGRGRENACMAAQRIVGPGPDALLFNIWSRILDVLREVCFCIPSFTKEIGLDDSFISSLFSLMRVKMLFDGAANLCEEILCARDITFDLEKVHDFSGLVAGFSAEHIAVFARVLSVILHDREDLFQVEPATSLGLLKSRMRTMRSGTIVQRNQKLLAENPRLLQHLVHVLRIATKRFPSPPQRAENQGTQDDDASEQEGGQASPLDMLSTTDLMELQAGIPGVTGEGIVNPQAVLSLFQDEGAFIGRRRQLAQTVLMLLGPANLLHVVGDNTVDWQDVPEPVEEATIESTVNSLFSEDSTEAGTQSRLAIEASSDSSSLWSSLYDGVSDVLHSTVLSQLLAAVLINSANPGDAGDGREDDETSHLQQRLKLQRVTQQVEVVFLLAVLAGGKSKNLVNRQLASYGLVETLSRLFSSMEWNCQHETPVHGPSCECSSPVNALKIQFLRLVHNYCDRQGTSRANKRLLLSPNDLLTCSQLHKELETGELVSLEKIMLITNSEGTNEMSTGLLHRIVDLLKQEDSNSQYRFWIASSVESFLRGSSQAEQLLLTGWGLIEHLVDVLLENGFKSQGMLQTNFDLLGEIVKFNKSQFVILSQCLSGEKFTKFMRLAMTNLIDSNVFIRTVILSLEHFRETDPKFVRDNQLEIFLDENRMVILRALMTIIEVKTISQENICCINTALLFFLFAHKKGTVSEYIDAVSTIDGGSVDGILNSWRIEENQCTDAKSLFSFAQQKNSTTDEFSTTIMVLETLLLLCKWPGPGFHFSFIKNRF